MVVDRFQDGNYYPATIAKKENKFFMLEWDDGQTEDTVKTAGDLQELTAHKPELETESDGASSDWGLSSEEEEEDEDDDDEDDEDEDEDEDGDEDEDEDEEEKSQSEGGGSFNIGDRVEAKYRNGMWYGGVVERVEGAKYVLTWDDGDSADRMKSAKGAWKSACSVRHGPRIERR